MIVNESVEFYTLGRALLVVWDEEDVEVTVMNTMSDEQETMTISHDQMEELISRYEESKK